MPLLSVFESDFLTNHSLVPTSLFELRRDKSDFRLLSWESGSCAPFKNGICDLHQTSIEIDWIAKTDIQTCINLAIFISRRIWVVVSARPADAFTAVAGISFTRACGRWGSRHPNQPVFRADFVQNVCGIRTEPRPGRWRISSAEPKRVKKRSPQRWNGRSTRQKAGQYTAWDWRSASRPLPISGRLSVWTILPCAPGPGWTPSGSCFALSTTWKRSTGMEMDLHNGKNRGNLEANWGKFSRFHPEISALSRKWKINDGD